MEKDGVMQWYYARGGTQSGPVDEQELKARIARGLVMPADLVWRDGMPDWLPVAQVPELRELPTGVESPETAEPAPVEVEVAVSPYQPPASQVVRQQYYSGGMQVGASSNKAMACLVLGICGLVFSVCCSCVGLVLGVLAVIFGAQAKQEIARMPFLAHELGKTKAGIIMGWVAIGISLLSGIAGVIINVSSSTLHNFK